MRRRFKNPEISYNLWLVSGLIFLFVGLFLMVNKEFSLLTIGMLKGINHTFLGVGSILAGVPFIIKGMVS